MPSLSNSDNLNIVISTEANTGGVTKTQEELGTLEDRTKSLSNNFTNMTKAFVFGNVIYSLTADLAVKVKEGFNEVGDSAKLWQQEQGQLNAVLESTKGVAGVTKDSAIELAESIAKTTPVSRESSLAAENMLLTFKSISKNEFPDTTKAVIDMATAMSGGATPTAEKLKDTAIQVGKAMQDPIAGATALRRVGVQLSDQQKEQIKDFMASGNQMAAQKIILGELTSEFGGSATNAAKTFSGQMQMLKNRLVDLGVAGLKRVVADLQTTYEWYQRNHRVVNDVISVVVALGGAILIIVTIYKIWQTAIKAIEIAQLALNLIMEMNPIILIMTAIIAIILLVAMHWQQLKDIVARVWADISGFVRDHMALILTLILGPIGLLIANWSKVRDFFKGLIDDIVNFFKGLPDRAVAAIGNIGQRIGNDIKNALHAVHIPGFATGIQNFGGGLAWVGERGPELVNLPGGSSVYTNSQSKAMGGGNAPTQNTFTGNIILGSAGAVTQFFQQINQDTLLAGKGLTVRQGM